MIDDRTSFLDLPLPNQSNRLLDDVGRIRNSLTEIDTHLSNTTVTNIATLRLTTRGVSVKISTQGYYTAGDGGHGEYWYDAADTSTADNGGDVIVGADGARWKLLQPWNPFHYGVRADGVTNDTAAFLKALTALTIIDLNGKAVLLTNTPNTLFTFSNKTIKNGIFNITVSSTSYSRTFKSNGNFNLYNCEFNYTVPVGGSVSFMTPATGDKVEKCKINGGVYNNGGTVSHNFYFHQCNGTGEQRNVHTIDCEIDAICYVHLKTISETSIQRGWRFINCTISNVFKEGVGINSPAGTVEDFVVRDCRFLSHQGVSMGQYSLYAAIATGTGITIDSCWFEGVVSQCIHIEENVKKFTVTNNKGLVDCKSGVIGLLENNLAGSYTWPERGVVSGNIFTKAGTTREANSIGLLLTFNASPESPANNITVTDNIFDGFERPYSLMSGASHRHIFRGNHALNGVDGFYLAGLFGSLDGNYSTDCTNGITVDGNVKLVANHTFKNCTNLFVGRYIANSFKVIYDSYAATSGGSVSKTLFTTSANQTHDVTYTIMSLLNLSNVDVSIKTGTFTFNGATAGGATLNTIEPGLLAGFYEHSGGVVRARIFSAGAGTLNTTVNVDGIVSNI